jgi:sulfatase modifying factor 1
MPDPPVAEAADPLAQLLASDLLCGTDERYTEYIAATMLEIPSTSFAMGTKDSATRHFCGEAPQHEVELSPFAISKVPVTNEVFALVDDRRRDLCAADRSKPVTDVTWCDAVVFAAWMGCRLPTEAEWEFACGGGAPSEWCCREEGDLPRYAWFSENARGEPHSVGQREPNALGLFDLHGNVWEWCWDAYDQDYYARASRRDPLHGNRDPRAHRVCRGGSMHALAEMCRTRYRLHEPADFWATDLGFRLARDVEPRVPPNGP